MVRGLELLFNLTKTQLQSKFDCAIAAVHCLLTNEGLECHGIGDSFSKDDKPSELLPPGWNDNQDVYTLRYSGESPRGKYLLKAVRTGNHILNVNVVYQDVNPATMSIHVDKMIGDDFQDYSTAYSDLATLVKDFRNQILDKLFIQTPSASNKSRKHDVKKPVESTPESFEKKDRLPVGEPAFPRVGGHHLHPLSPDHEDLVYHPLQQSNPRDPRFFDPLAASGGFPRRSVPPGARFDPIGPPMRGPSRPTPDHFKPPNFGSFY